MPAAVRPTPAPACEIFNRFLERLAQRDAYADDLLKHEKFTFDTDERITINRKDLPYPADLDEAKKLWRERLRFEYLQELLGKIGARKRAWPRPQDKHRSPPKRTRRSIPPSGTGGKNERCHQLGFLIVHRHGAGQRRGADSPTLPSPKDSDRAAALQAAAAKARAKAEADRKALEGAPPKPKPWQKADRPLKCRRAWRHPPTRPARPRERGDHRDAQPPLSPQPALLYGLEQRGCPPGLSHRAGPRV